MKVNVFAFGGDRRDETSSGRALQGACSRMRRRARARAHVQALAVLRPMSQARALEGATRSSSFVERDPVWAFSARDRGLSGGGELSRYRKARRGVCAKRSASLRLDPARIVCGAAPTNCSISWPRLSRAWRRGDLQRARLPGLQDRDPGAGAKPVMAPESDLTS